MVADVSSDRNNAPVMVNVQRNNGRAQAPFLLSPAANPERKERRRPAYRAQRTWLNTANNVQGPGRRAENVQGPRFAEPPGWNMSGDRKLATERFQRIVAAYEAVSAHRTTFATTREP